jgi:Zn-dependent peptidase ImmA (M78 family)
LGVTVWSVHDIAPLADNDISVLADQTDDSWAALTMRIETENLVVYKPVNSSGRRNNVIMHELAHIVLGHDLADACIMEDGSLAPGNFDQAQENEADWLAGTLLLPRPALMSIRRGGIPDPKACQHYMVSQEMLLWRFRMTGVDYQLANTRR